MSLKKIIRRPWVIELSGLSTSSIDRREKAGDFPQRVQLGGNSVGWYEDEVLDWIMNRPRGHITPPEQALAANPKHQPNLKAASELLSSADAACIPNGE